MRQRSTAICFLALVNLSLIGCTGPNSFLQQYANSFGNVVTAPRSDSSAPTASLVISDMGNGQQTLMNGGQPVTINITPKTDGFFIVGIAEDPQGIKSVAFGGSSGLVCQMGDTASMQSGDLGGPQYQNKAVAGQNTTTRLWLPNYIYFAGTGCPKHYKFVSQSIALFVTATNYGGVSTTSPYATFVYNP